MEASKIFAGFGVRSKFPVVTGYRSRPPVPPLARSAGTVSLVSVRSCDILVQPHEVTFLTWTTSLRSQSLVTGRVFTPYA